MRQLDAMCREFLSHRSGATAIEYSLIAAGIALVIVATVQVSGTQLATLFQAIIDGFVSMAA